MEIFEIRKSYKYWRDLPLNYQEGDAFRFDPIRECEVSRAFIERAGEVKICQYYIFSNQKILEDYCLPIQMRGKQNVVKQWLKAQLFPKFHVEEAIWISDRWSRNYFHWILESVPRILALRNAGINLPLLIQEHFYKIPYIRESLEDLNIKTITFNLRQTVKVNKLYMPSHDSPCAFDRMYLESVIGFYNTKDGASDKPALRKIYISRREALKRKITNEEELIPLLLNAGFECVQMEKLSFKEQRDLMKETAVLLSLHGAGLANMIFMQEGSKVIELHPDAENYNSCFFHLASAIGMKYYYSFEIGDHPNPQEANISVDLQKIEGLLNML